MKNPLGYLGFLGLLGILSLVTHHWMYLWFFCFFIFFVFFKVIPDELFRENIKRSATPAFFTSLVLYVLTVAFRPLYNSDAVYMACLIIAFAASFLVFFILLAVYSARERRG
ncbi:Protein of unknown function [Sporobacter termitidis DSM 10068]|uniref:DUF3796 domain-containing protein n=1 Tax=Sporobacter termitidis DSM 10068 TaxID=1123282 RepID=A0A1M5X2R6_9FIRM|nr:DUF3796 domain-containing protein [Sporobacter termitidis]SHH94166.1 Protein of unknown function [Sporobacter termitidis DSM 10068]